MAASAPWGRSLMVSRLPRALHPMAWWLWALGLATAASRTTNPLLILVLVGVVAYVVLVRRGDAPWARAFSAYLVLGLVVVAIRVVFHAVLGTAADGHVLFALPEVGLPDWAAGIKLGGDVSAEQVLAATYDGLRLAALLCCVGAANALANPKRALRSLPAALYEVGSAVVVAMSVAPQLVESVFRVRRARRLRGAPGKGLRSLRSIALPVLEDALSRSLMLAAAMDSRGYGRTGETPKHLRRTTSGLVLVGLMGLCLGLYGLLDPTVPKQLGLPALAVGLVLCAAGLRLGGRRVRRTTYRPDPWRGPEWVVAGCGIVSATVMFFVGNVDPLLLHPSLYPLAWPDLPTVPLLAVLLGLLPAWVAPRPERAAQSTLEARRAVAA
jgi:energy-coupling factor transport system permease protein